MWDVTVLPVSLGSSVDSAASTPCPTKPVMPRTLRYTRPVMPAVRPGWRPLIPPTVRSTDWCTPSVMSITPSVAWVASCATARKSDGLK